MYLKFVYLSGISAKYKADSSAYGAGSDMGLTYTTDTDHDIDTNTTAKFTYGDDIGGWNNVQYHTPAGLLPFGLGKSSLCTKCRSKC